MYVYNNCRASRMNLTTVLKTDPFWFDDISILFRTNRLTEFMPNKIYTLEEQLNAIMRFTIYTCILLFFYYNNSSYVYGILAVAGLTIFIYRNRQPSDSLPNPQNVRNIEKLENIESESQNKRTDCQVPTMDNPFMNATMKDYMSIDEDGTIRERLPACDSDDPEIKKKSDEFFYNNLYRDVDDVFGKMNSQRQFFTMPSTTIPNKQDEFAKWLYLSPKTCKEDQDYCLRYEDVRAKAPVLMDPDRNPISARDD